MFLIKSTNDNHILDPLVLYSVLGSKRVAMVTIALANCWHID